MAKRVVWTEAARLSRREILEYWTDRTGSKTYSKKISEEFNERIDCLKEHPEMGKATELKKIRTTSCGHFSIFYLNEPKEIVIIGIYDTRRDPEVILQTLKSANRHS